MGFWNKTMLDFLFEARKKKNTTPVIDYTNADPNNGDSVLMSGYENFYNASHIQFKRNETEAGRIRTYRTIAKTSEIDEVVTDIVNETLIFQRDKKAFELDWYSNCAISDQLKEKIYNEFVNIYNLSNFDEIGLDCLYSFYVDGRIAFQKSFDPDNKKQGIKRIVQLDPLNLVRIKLLPRRDIKTKMIDVEQVQEFYVFTNTQVNNQHRNLMNNVFYSQDEIIDGVRLETDQITYITSGLIDSKYVITISHLDKAILPYNNLKMMEQSMLIFRIVRAPVRRAFYIDVSSMPKNRAEEYMRNMSNRFKSKLQYNAEDGTWLDKKSVVSMVEDYFIPRFNDGKTTEIQNIDGQSSQEILDEVNYMNDKLYQALNAPKSRYKDESKVYIFGKTDQIPQEEYRFKKFIDRLRHRFMLCFDDLLKTQLILKGIISEDDWQEVKSSYFWNYNEDNAFTEFKDNEIMTARMNMAVTATDLIEHGYLSKHWIRKNILKQTDEEIQAINEQLFIESSEEPNEPPSNDYDKSDNEVSDDTDMGSGNDDDEADDEPPTDDDDNE